MINITLSLKDGTTISAMQLAKATDAVENTLKSFLCDSSRCDPEHFRQFADEIEKKAKELARLSREWAEGLEAYREKAESPNVETCEVKGTTPAAQEEKNVDGSFWDANAKLTRLMGVLEDGFRREGDVEELEKLLEESNKYIRRTIEKLREAKSDQENGAAYGYDAKGDRVTLVEASKGDIPDWLKSGLATCATATESEVLLRAYDELQALGSSPH